MASLIKPSRRGFIKGLGASFLAAPAIVHARGLSMLLGSPPSDAGGGPAPYDAKAVHFDGATWLSIDSLTSIDNGDFSFVLWYTPMDAASGSGSAWFVDPQTADTYCTLSRSIDAGLAPNPDIEFSDNSSSFFDCTSGGISLNDGWNSLICTAKTDLAAGSKIFKVYLNRIDVTNLFTADDGGAGSFNIRSNGLPFTIGGQPVPELGIICDFADIRIMPGISLLTGSDISPPTIALFADSSNKPVNPAVATAALGTPGAILFSGDADTFPVNQGTGGAFTLTGTLTNASSSPSD